MASQREVPVPVTRENNIAAAAAPDLTDSMTAKIMQSMSASHSDGTLKTYASAWRRFESWCQTNQHAALPAHPTTVAACLVDAADTFTPDGERAFAPSTLSKWVAGISHTHRRSGHISPTEHGRARCRWDKQPGNRAVALSEHEAACGVLWLERPVCARRY
ncbi:hypothetical protein NOU13_28110 [Rhodococcus erythropolis]|uniref:hypothetical protein n=1 Tax=Rhodococcus erythropolis TaxID=1833 RepID=UPI00210B1E60|nr:hypothetical protein [Rhodococcus erythropolis]MCQ4128368.1 hypothetical protein [Rhodococcus erythropolis]